MAKPVRSSRRKSSGKRSPSTQDLRYYSEHVKGSTDGVFAVSALPTHKPEFAKRNRLTSGKLSKLTRDDVAKLPADALVALDGASQAVVAVYHREAQPCEPREAFRESHDKPDYSGFTYEADGWQ
jgi:hypothetical protein